MQEESRSGLSIIAGGPRRVAAFVHADMVGYSRLISQDDTGTSARLARLRLTLIDPALNRYGGKIHNTAGDSLMMEFPSVLSAVRFAVGVQSRIPEFDEGEPPDRRIRFRMGIDVGDAIPDGQNVHGDSVNIAARLQAICPAGCVCVSAVVRNHVRDLDLRFEPLGNVDLKNIGRPIEAYVVRLDHSPGPPGRFRYRRGLAAASVLLLLVAAGWLGMHRSYIQQPQARSVGPLSIAVLPFINLSGDHDEDYLADGISEDLTTDLSHLQGVQVVARESAFTYRGKSVDVRDVGRELGVGYVLEGSVRKLGDVVRINAQLVSAETGAHVWADRFDQRWRDLRDGQDNTVQRIGSALDLKLDDTSRRRSGNVATDPAAYDLVLRAKAVMQQPRGFIRNVIAEGYFEQALLKDPNSVEARAGAATMLLETNRYYNRAARLITSAEWEAPDHPDVLGAKFRLLTRQGHYSDAVDTFRHLLDVDSSSAGIAAEFVRCAPCWGPPEEAAPLLERTARLNPLAPNREVIYATLGRMLIMLGRDADAVPWLEQAWDIVRLIPPSEVMARDADDFTIEYVKLYLAAAYAYTGRREDAHRLILSVLASDKSNDFTVRSFLKLIPAFLSRGQRAQEERLVEGFRRAGLRDHLDETEDLHVASASALQNSPDNPTPMGLPGATTVLTAEMQDLLRTTPKLLILTTSPSNPSIPGSILVSSPVGRLDDDWQKALGTLMERATNGNKDWPIVTFAYSIYHWHARNLALRLLALGYKRVYWYRGGWEAWDSHDLAKSPLTVQFGPRDQASQAQVTPASR